MTETTEPTAPDTEVPAEDAQAEAVEDTAPEDAE